MISDEFKLLMDKKIAEINKDPMGCKNEAFFIISKLNAFLDNKLELKDEEISFLIDKLTVFTVYSEIPISVGSNISRAVNYELLLGEPYFKNLSRISYIPKEKAHIAKIGRMNISKTPMYYGSLYSNNNSLGTVLSEIKAKKGKKYNFLISEVKEDLHVVPIGVFDYFRRGIEHPFKLNNEFNEMYTYVKSNTKVDGMIAMQLCDAFLTDVLKREGNDRLYRVTSKISEDCLSFTKADGIIYPSVEFVDYPNIVLKPDVVDSKISHKIAYAVYVEESFGYGIYLCKWSHSGGIYKDEIIWEPIIPKNIRHWKNILSRDTNIS